MANRKLEVKTGDWVYCGTDCIGILTHIFTKRYAPYDEIPDYSDEKLKVGDIMFTIGQYKTFAKEDGTLCKRLRTGCDDLCLYKITKADMAKLNRVIKENPEKYQKFLEYNRTHYEYEEYRFCMPEGYTIEDIEKLFDSYRKELPERFTFNDLSEICKKKNSPVKMEDYEKQGFVFYHGFYMVLFYPIEDFDGQDIRYESLRVYTIEGETTTR